MRVKHLVTIDISQACAFTLLVKSASDIVNSYQSITITSPSAIVTFVIIQTVISVAAFYFDNLFNISALVIFQFSIMMWSLDKSNLLYLNNVCLQCSMNSSVLAFSSHFIFSSNVIIFLPWFRLFQSNTSAYSCLLFRSLSIDICYVSLWKKDLTAMQDRDTILTAQHSTAQHSTTQHSTAQHSTG